MELWTQRVLASFGPTLRFFDGRFEIVRELESRYTIRDFGVHEDRVSLRLEDPSHRLMYSPTRIGGGVLQPDGESTRIEDAIAMAWRGLGSPRLLRHQLSFRWLERLATPYDDARRSAVIHLVGGAGSVMTDFAMTCDGRLAAPDIQFQLQFGVVASGEIPARLADSPDQIHLWEGLDIPEVAFFCDTSFRGFVPTVTAAGFIDTWRDSRDAGRRLACEMLGRIRGGEP